MKQAGLRLSLESMHRKMYSAGAVCSCSRCSKQKDHSKLLAPPVRVLHDMHHMRQCVLAQLNRQGLRIPYWTCGAAVYIAQLLSLSVFHPADYRLAEPTCVGGSQS